MNLTSIFGYDAVFSVFRENLWDVPALHQSWLELLGLGDHNAFECVGEVDETRLAFEACRRAGYTGKAMDTFTKHFAPKDAAEPPKDGQKAIDYEALRAKFNQVYEVNHGIQAWIFDKVKLNMQRD